MVFDRGKDIHDLDLLAEREKEGYTLTRIGPYQHTDTVLKQHSDWWMASAHNLKPKQGRFAQEAGVKMLCDSGGWQIKSGAADYVDPHEVIKVHNACAEAGMVLDYPPRRDVDTTDEVFQVLSRIQKGHNEIFKAKKRDDLDLINVAHGVRSDQWRRWIETVNEPEHFQGWAISQDSDLDKACIYRGAAILYKEFGIRDEWVHLFGVSGPNMLPVVARLGCFFPNLTSDSSSWMGGKYGNFLYFKDGVLRTLKIGTKAPQVKDADPLNDYCQCEFCAAMGTFGGYRQNGAYPALSAHCVIAIQQTVAHWNRLATELTPKEYRDEVQRAFGRQPKQKGRDAAKVILNQLDYLEAALAEGPEYADKHFSMK